MQDERFREDAKQLLRVAYERQVASGDVGARVDLGAAAKERGLGADSPHLAALTDYMGVAGWVEPDTTSRARVVDQFYLVTGRGMEVLREAIG